MTEKFTDNDIQITIKIFGGLRESVQSGTQIHRMACTATLDVLLEKLSTDFPDLSAKLVAGLDAGYLNVLINGRNIQFLQGHDTPLQDGDTVAFLPPVGGG